MTTVTHTLAQARRRLGIQEDPRNSNRTPIGVEFGWNGVAWCAEFVSVVLAQAGFRFTKSASCRGLYSEFRERGWHSIQVRSAKAGDVVFFNWPGTAYPMDHVGMVEGRKVDGRLITIEGNTTLANGNGGVARKVRSTGTVAAIIRPPYQAETRISHTPIPTHKLPPNLHLGNQGPWIRALQMRLGGLAITGRFGARTEDRVKAFQRKHHLTVDGVVGPKTWKALGY